MSDQELHFELGKALAEHGRVKQELVLLLSKAHRWGQGLSGVADLLATRLQQSPQGGPEMLARPLGPSGFEYPTQDQIRELVEEIAEVAGRKSALARTLKDAGYEPKE